MIRNGVVPAAALLVLAIIAAYRNSFTGPFVFDDFPAIRDNPTLRALGDVASVFSPPPASGVGGRPLANFSFALNHALSGTTVGGYHAVNLALHVGSALLFFGIVRQIRGARDIWPAFTIALAWAVHPLTTAAVSYLSQRTEVLMAFFYLLTLYAFMRGNAAPKRSEIAPINIASHRGWLILSVIACALGMMSKEVMVTAPILVLLYDRTFVAGTFRNAWRLRRSYYMALAASWLVLGYLLTTGLSQRSVGYGLGVSAFDYAVTECRAIMLYLKLAVWPTPLVFDYGRSYTSTALLTGVSIVGVIGLMTWTAIALGRRAKIGFPAACFLLLLAPTSSVVPVAEQPIAENRAYLPLAALVALGVAAAHLAIPPRLRSTLAGLAVGGLGILTHARNETYRSEAILWSDTVQRRPQNARAQFNCGLALLHEGRPADAIPYFERALQLDPSDPKPRNSLGNALLELGRPAEAVGHFAAAVEREPGYARGWYNYGTALHRLRDSSRAIECFQRALQLEPHDAGTYDALGNVYFQLDRPAEAIPHYEQALRLDPKMADAYYNCGSAYFELGRMPEAIAHFAAAATLKPGDAEIRNNWGAALLRAGHKPEAIAQFEYALRLEPGYAKASDNLQLARQQ